MSVDKLGKCCWCKADKSLYSYLLCRPCWKKMRRQAPEGHCNTCKKDFDHSIFPKTCMSCYCKVERKRRNNVKFVPVQPIQQPEVDKQALWKEFFNDRMSARCYVCTDLRVTPQKLFVLKIDPKKPKELWNCVPCCQVCEDTTKEKNLIDFLGKRAQALLFHKMKTMKIESTTLYNFAVNTYNATISADIIQPNYDQATISDLDMNLLEYNRRKPISSNRHWKAFSGFYNGAAVTVREFIYDEDFAAERSTWEIIKGSPKVVHYYGAYQDASVSIIVVESFGTTLDSIRQELSKAQIIAVSLEIAIGLSFLHKKGIIYRDLKPTNILVSQDRMAAKLCNVAMATEEKTFNKTCGVGAAEYTAPEVMHSNNYSYKADVYSFGLILLELFTRKKIDRSKLERTSEVKEEMQVLIESCIDNNPYNRPSFDSIIKIIQFNNTTRRA